MNERCIKVLVSGRVQGVYFRGATRNLAGQLGLTGYAINLPDGRVEVVACGADQALDALTKWLRQGPSSARVTGLELEEIAPRELKGFSTG